MVFSFRPSYDLNSHLQSLARDVECRLQAVSRREIKGDIAVLFGKAEFCAYCLFPFSKYFEIFLKAWPYPLAHRGNR